MKIEVKPGRYVLAVSGGVDSMVLLDLLAKKPGLELVVAHFDHGVRSDSFKDERFVREKTEQLGLSFEAGYGHLGEDASEETARDARYKFLYKVQKKYAAECVITAHHQDDLIETALLNLLRGTGRHGLTAISTNQKVLRPLLKYSKAEILIYAKRNGIKWRKDGSNSDNSYLRNYLRNRVLSNLTPKNRGEILKNVEKVAKTDSKINYEIAKLSQYIIDGQRIDRLKFSLLPFGLAEELVIYWLRQQKIRDFDRKTVSRINSAIRTYRGDSECEVIGGAKLKIFKKTAQFSNTV